MRILSRRWRDAWRGCDREASDKDREEIAKAAGAIGAQGPAPLRVIVNRLLDAVDADKQIEKAREMFGQDRLAPAPDQVKQATEALTAEACAVFDNPQFRNTVIEIKQRNEQTIDTVSQDHLIAAGFDATATERARRTVETFQQFIAEHKDELTALQIIYSMPYGRRHLTYAEIKELAAAIEKPPYRLTPEGLWQAYEQLEKNKVRGAGAQKLLTNLVSLVRFALGECDTLEPFSATVDQRFEGWLAQQKRAGHTFTPEQREWLTMIKDQITTSLSIGWDDFDFDPFYGKGGRIKASNLFGQEMDRLMEELNAVLVA